MNVIIANEKQEQLSGLDIDIIKSITGTYEANEIVEMFKNFFYSKMILDVTAIKNYESINSYQTLANGLDVEKIIFYLPEGSNLCTSNFLANLVDIGIYNFTTNLDGVKYLLRKTNTLKDVSHIQQLRNTGSEIATSAERVTGRTTIIGIKNVTEHAGATTFTYMLKKELESVYGSKVIAVEVNKRDFQAFNNKAMFSVAEAELTSLLDKYKSAKIILIDLNDLADNSMCAEVLYLLEPSIIKINKLLRRNRSIFNHLKNRKVILNKSLLSNKDVGDFEYEANIRVFYNMPPLNERNKNGAINDFLSRLGLLEKTTESKNESSSKIFGLFRR